MRDVFFEMSLIHLGQAEGIIKGLITEPTMHVDPFFVNDVKVSIINYYLNTYLLNFIIYYYLLFRTLCINRQIVQLV